MTIYGDILENSTTFLTAAGVSFLFGPGMGMGNKFMVATWAGMTSDIVFRGNLGGLTSESVYRTGYVAGMGAITPDVLMILLR